MTTWYNTRPPQNTNGKLIAILNGDVYKIGHMVANNLYSPSTIYLCSNPRSNFWTYLDRDCYFNPRRTDKPDIKIDDSWNKSFDLAPKGVVIEIMVLQGKENKIHVADAELDDSRGILQPNKVPFGIGSNSLFYAWRPHKEKEAAGSPDGNNWHAPGSFRSKDLIDIRIRNDVSKSSRIVAGVKFSYGEYRVRNELVSFHLEEYVEAWRPHKPVPLNDIWLKARREKKNEQEIKDILKEDLKKHIKLNENAQFSVCVSDSRVVVDFCRENNLDYKYGPAVSGGFFYFTIQPKQEIK